MKRRIAIIAAALSLASVLGTATASADMAVNAKETNGCIVVDMLQLAICFRDT